MTVDELHALALEQATAHARGSRIHGPAHWLRVAENGATIAERTTGADAEVVRVFALFHDSQRLTDGADPEHGARAAQAASRLAGGGRLALSRVQLEVLEAALVDHDRGWTSTNPTIAACWDADRLDLTRLGVSIRPELLSTLAAVAIVRRQSPVKETPGMYFHGGVRDLEPGDWILPSSATGAPAWPEEDRLRNPGLMGAVERLSAEIQMGVPWLGVGVTYRDLVFCALTADYARKYAAECRRVNPDCEPGGFGDCYQVELPDGELGRRAEPDGNTTVYARRARVVRVIERRCAPELPAAAVFILGQGDKPDTVRVRYQDGRLATLKVGPIWVTEPDGRRVVKIGLQQPKEGQQR